ncbi:CIC11C00000003834 [Sungouiella intermedia]|uniref:CIC11C00000003005 n=1 Tax=Sungouiella intermedia TaxID=45354 RepID=A0A1L0GCR9_9ASCO|nr:CIC11C00000003005 [[Candida] intermedia]SGZ54299.1 CIC11C00000003834 [[Candida] intermedia]
MLDVVSNQNQKEESVVQTTRESHDPKYDRFSPIRKRSFVMVASLSCLLSPLSSLAFLPAVSEIAEEFKTNGTVINVSNAVYLIVLAVSPCIMGPCGDIYGRKIIFILCLLLFSATTLLTGLAQNLAMFYVFRSLAALFGTAFFSTAGSVVGDIYPPQQRGSAMGWLLLGTQVGPAFGPCIGGIIVTYTSWRVIFYFLAGFGGLVLALVVVLLKETSVSTKYKEIRAETGKRLIIVPFNPFRVILALKHHNLLLAGFMSVSLHYNMYVLLTPIRYVMNPRFNLEKPIYAGLFYLCPGMGYLVGSYFGGRWADRYVRRYINKRGRRVSEDRLRSELWAHGLVLPATILVYGWCLKEKKGGIPVPAIMMFINGFAQTICFPSLNTYCVDSMPLLKGDAIASNYMIRFLAGAVGTASVLKQIHSIGVGWTCTISAVVLFGGFLLSLTLVISGEKMRMK